MIFAPSGIFSNGIIYCKDYGAHVLFVDGVYDVISTRCSFRGYLLKMGRWRLQRYKGMYNGEGPSNCK